MKTTNNIEQAILHAAEEMFLEKGYSMVSTTDIANRVGCNQAMVHYYYRTKENLFMKVFTTKVDTLFQIFSEIIATEQTLLGRINLFIDKYFELFIANPRIPFLVVNELILNPTRRSYMYDYITHSATSDFYDELKSQVEFEVSQGHIRPITTFDLVQNIVSLTAFTFVGLPVVNDFLIQNQFNLEDYLLHRRSEIRNFVIQSIQPSIMPPLKLQ